MRASFVKQFLTIITGKMALFALSFAMLLSTSMTPNTASAAIEEVKFNSEIHNIRYKEIIDELRCLVCQNQNLAGSSAPLAIDLKRLVEDLIKQGKSDQEIYNFLTERYGDFVLYDPPLKGTTYLLWFGPLLFFIIGIIIFIGQIRKRQSLKH